MYMKFISKAVFKSIVSLPTELPLNCRLLHSSGILLKKQFRPPVKFTKVDSNKRLAVDNDIDNAIDFESASEESDDPVYQEIVDRTFRVPEMGHNVLVIQPYIKWGPSKKKSTTPALQLAEAVSLIKTLNMWKVADSLTVPLLTFSKTTLFGKGNLEKIQDTVLRNKGISAVFISIDILKGVQKSFLENLLKVPIYDRYMIVLQIFREHAVSREAKLQLKLAEIPYLRGLVRQLEPTGHFTGSSGETFTEFQHNLLKEREKQIRKAIESLRSQRDLLRRKRRRSHMLVVAVVGYTNAGKTSLIKALTGEESMNPKDVLFATLDVTVHAGFLPSGLKVLYIDTIGFISDIPTNLIESFVATLEDAVLADVIVHVLDASHPDTLAQNEQVMKTLASLNLSEDMMNNIVVVGNKVDLMTDVDKGKWEGVHLVSVLKNQGMDEVKLAIETAILKATGLQRIDVRVRNGADEYQWLQREATVCDVRADPNDPQFCIMSLIIAPHVLAKFKHHFIAMKR